MRSERRTTAVDVLATTTVRVTAAATVTKRISARHVALIPPPTSITPNARSSGSRSRSLVAGSGAAAAVGRGKVVTGVAGWRGARSLRGAWS